MTERIIAIGDVHGCSKALATLVEAIQPTELDTLVFLGDFIDRGPDGRGVLPLGDCGKGQNIRISRLVENHRRKIGTTAKELAELDTSTTRQVGINSALRIWRRRNN